MCVLSTSASERSHNSSYLRRLYLIAISRPLILRMKLLTEKQIAEHDAASRRGALEGTIVSASVALAGSYYLNRTWSAYRRFPLSLKALGIVIVTAPCLAIQAERRGLEYDRSQWESEATHVYDEKRLQEEQRWKSLPLSDKISDWVARHQYPVILGGWALSLGVAGAVISRQRYQTFSQKIVQARMWAQGLTIGLLIVAGALTHTKRKEFAQEQQHDHSWADIIEQQEHDRKDAEALKMPAGSHDNRRALSAHVDRA